MSGNEVKQVIKDSGLKGWEVAYAWGMTDGNFSRKLRKPFSDDDVKKLHEIIRALTKSRSERS